MQRLDQATQDRKQVTWRGGLRDARTSGGACCFPVDAAQREERIVRREGLAEDLEDRDRVGRCGAIHDRGSVRHASEMNHGGGTRQPERKAIGRGRCRRCRKAHERDRHVAGAELRRLGSLRFWRLVNANGAPLLDRADRSHFVEHELADIDPRSIAVTVGEPIAGERQFLRGRARHARDESCRETCETAGR